MKILIKLHSGLGDIILGMPACKKVRELYPESHITCYMHHSQAQFGTIHHQMLEGFGYFNEYIFNPPEVPEGHAVKLFFADIPTIGDDKYDMYLTNVLRPGSDKETLMCGTHIVDLFNRNILGFYLLGEERIPRINFKDTGYVKSITGFDKWITVEFWATYQQKTIAKEKYTELIPFLTKKLPDYAILFIADKRAYDIDFGGSKNCFMMKGLDWDQLSETLGGSYFHFGIESGITTAAGAMGIPMIFLGLSPNGLVTPLKSKYVHLFRPDRIADNVSMDNIKKSITEVIEAINRNYKSCAVKNEGNSYKNI